MASSLTSLSKFLSLVLRHKPEHIGVELDAAGWVDVERLLTACAAYGMKVTRPELERVVRESDKQRFAFSADGRQIRANQGHSVAVELAHAPCAPPPMLYHGTVERFLDAIRSQGLCKRARHHVHLSANPEEAERVGARRGRPILLQVQAGAMAAQGFVFLRSPNGVWLTEHVPPAFLVFP